MTISKWIALREHLPSHATWPLGHGAMVTILHPPPSRLMMAEHADAVPSGAAVCSHDVAREVAGETTLGKAKQKRTGNMGSLNNLK